MVTLSIANNSDFYDSKQEDGNRQEKSDIYIGCKYTPDTWSMLPCPQPPSQNNNRKNKSHKIKHLEKKV